MKKWLLAVIAVSILALAACSNDTRVTKQLILMKWKQK